MRKITVRTLVLAAALALTGTAARSQVVVTASAGVMGPTMYPTLSAAIADVNAGLPQGIIGIGIMSNVTETGPVVLNASGAGAAVYTQLTIAPIADGVTISGPTTTGRGLIELNGADNVFIDGDNPNTAGTNRNLTITNTAANTVLRTSVIRLATSSLITNCDNVTIRNLNINGSGTGRNISSVTSETLTFGIVVSGNASTATTTTVPANLTAAATMASGQTAANLLITNNSVQTASRGIAVNGAATTNAPGLVISNNTVGNATAGAADQVWCMGITAQGSSNGVISGNIIYLEGFAQSSTVNKGIDIGTVNANGTFTIERNEIRRVSNLDAGTWPAVGINIAGGTGHVIRNNFISGLVNSMTSGTGAFGETYGCYGIRIAGGTGHQVIYNTVHLNGAIPGTTSTNITSCFVITLTSITGCTVQNNVFSNQMTGGNLTAQNMRHTCLLLPAGITSGMNLTINNNRYYQGGTTGSTIGQNGFVSGSSTDYLSADFNPAVITPAANMRSYTSTFTAAGTNDNASAASAAAPPMISATNLHVNLASPGAPALDGTAAVIAGTTNDFDLDVRSVSTPDIGADEFILSACVSASGGTISPSSVSTCAGQSVTMTSTGATSGGGITYQWMVGSTSGGPYVNVSGGFGANTTSYTTAALTAGTYYYVLQTTCSSGPVTGLSNEVTVVVNANPTVGVTPASSTYCTGGPGIALSATGAIAYAWTPSAGLSATTGANVTATPTVSTMYTVTGVNAAGCFGQANASVTVAASPTVTATATPSVICTGGNSQLLATANAPAYNVSSIAYAPTVGTGTSAVTGDDAMSAPITLPFSFNFYGTAYTQVNVCTNGFVQLGTSSASTTVYGAAMPTAANPNTIIAAVFSDLNIASPGQIVTYTTGVSPNQVFTIHYNNCQFYNSAFFPAVSGNINCQIQLFETSNIVEIHVGDVTGASSTTANKALGIEDATGTNAVSPATRNFVNWNVSTPEAWRFTPTTFAYSWNPGTFLSATNISNPMATGATASTNYTVTVTSNSGCTGTASAGFTVGAVLSTTSNITPSSTVCEGTTVTFNGGATGGGAPYTYSWTGPNSFSSTAQNPTLVTTTAASGTYVLTVTDACTTVSTTSVTLTVNANPGVAVTPTSGLFCTGSPAVTLNASGALTFNWAPSAGLTATTGSSVDASPSSSTTYTVIGTDGNGCTASATTAITSSVPPSGVSASASMSTICAGDTVDLMSTANTTATPLSQDFSSLGGWTVVNDPGSSAATYWMSQASPFNLIAGSLSFTNFSTVNGGNFYMSNSDAGGSGSTTNTQLISPVFSTMGMTSANLTFEHIYQRWASGDVTVAVDISIDGGATWNVLQAYTSDQGTVTANSQATAAANISLATYLNQPNLRIRYNYVAVWGYYWIVDNVVVSGAMAPSFSWSSSPANFTSSIQNPTDVIPAGTTDYIVTVSNAAGCTTRDTVTVNVNALPNVVANATATAVCMNDAVTFTGSGATTYTWTGGVADNVPYTPSVTDSYTVTGTDANGCVNTDNITVTVNALPSVAVNATATTVCMNDAVTFTGSGATTYTWDNGVTDGVPYTPAATATYVVTGTDANGCMNTDSVTVNVNALPAVTANASASAVCAGDSVTVMGGGAAMYSWDNGVTDNVPFALTATTTYIVTGTDANGCVNMDTITIMANVATGSLSLPMDTVCQSVGTITLSGETPAGGMWSGPGVIGNTFDPMTSGLGMIGITYMFTDSNGCSGSVVDSVLVDICLGTTAPAAVTTGVNIYPNPNEGQFIIQLSAVPNTPVKVELTNELGQVIDAFTMTGTTKEMNIMQLEGGVYFIRVTEGSNVTVHRVVKQ